MWLIMITFLIKIFATGLGAGYSPVLPGTMGTLLALLLAFFLPVNSIHYLIFITFFIGFSYFVIEQTKNIFTGPDDKRIVIDEMTGYWISILFLPRTITVLLIAFVLFRIFDGKKFLLIKKVESLPGTLGIISDDLTAGIITNVILQLLIYFALIK